MPKEQLSHGGAIHRRREIGAARQDISRLSKEIIGRLEARTRLKEIDSLLSPGNPILSLVSYVDRDKDRASLEIEQIWLKYKLGISTQAEQQSGLSKKFDDLEKGMPAVYDWLTKIDNGPSKAQQIRDKVIPPIRIAGFPTKR